MIRRYLELIQFSHTIFALPFALISVLVATAGHPAIDQLFWVVVAMAAARSGAMGFNRWIDRSFDAKNPRTAHRPSVTGRITPQSIVFLVIISYVILVISSYQLNPLAFYLSPVAIFLTLFYSWTKRFTSYSHLFLGLAIGSAPIAAWIAVRGEISVDALILGTSVLFWIGGFDILYALQDKEFDEQHGLYSIPVRFGVLQSLWIARIFHGVTAMLWWYFFWKLGFLGWLGVGWFLCVGLLILEQYMVRTGNLQKLPVAFFNINGLISLTLLASTLLFYWT